MNYGMGYSLSALDGQHLPELGQLYKLAVL
jgi:hypothetical protein